MASAEKAAKKKSSSKTSSAGVKKTAKQASSKKPLAKKAANKQSASTKTRIKTFVQTKAGNAARQKTDPEHRRRMIAETSYFIAERRGFVSGLHVDDWLEAEVLVDRLLAPGESRIGTPALSSK